LLNAGIDCTLLGRASICRELTRYGLRLTDYENRDILLKGPTVISDSDTLPKADIVLLTVKCKDVAAAAKDLAGKITEDTLVVCLQNGIGAKEVAAGFLPKDRLLSGVVGFNVLNMGKGRFHRGNQGELILESHPKLAPDLFDQEGMPARFSKDIESVLWGKLILNLNNCINALSGLPLIEQLSQRGYRRILAASMRELLGLLRQKRIKPEAINGVPPFLSAHLLCLPNFLFLRVAKKMLKIDPLARSSMWEDLEKGRETEIDYLNGAVTRLAIELGRSARVSSRLIELIKEAEDAGKGSPKLSPEKMTKLLGVSS
jgi:2-dehydropantoate 2-reductase